LLIGDVADSEADAPAGDVLQIQDLRRGYGRAEDDIAVGGELERDIARPRPPPAPVSAADRPECSYGDDIARLLSS
jgi:hypothetical protein